ncbi:MAG: hypothetical protein J6C86_04140 [Bacteroidaceae bacterium]|nr:hypothetical protein [Bacteroidaceae bacterium]
MSFKDNKRTTTESCLQTFGRKNSYRKEISTGREEKSKEINQLAKKVKKGYQTIFLIPFLHF